MAEIVEIGTISSRGQIAIPSNVRKELDLKDGEKVLFVLEGDTLIIKKVSSQNKVWEEIKMPLKETRKKSANLNSKDIVTTLNKNKNEINNFGVKKIGLFGSFAKGRQNEKSDIDILVKFYNSNFDNYMGLKFFLEKIFGKKVDLVIENGLKPELVYIKKGVKYARL